MKASAVRAAALGVLALLLVSAGAALGPSFSTAAFATQSTNTANRIGAAADWTPPTVSLQTPALPLRGIVSLTATAADGETGVRDVAIAVQPAGTTTWTPVCTATAAPYGCTWDTRATADGVVAVRAIATDNAGYSSTSALQFAIANHVGVTLANPGAVVRGAVPLTTTLQDAGTAAFTVRVERAVAGSGTWTAVCGGLAAPYACTWSTTQSPDGAYDLRSVAVLNGVESVSNAIAGVLVDNTAPAVTMNDPGSPLRGTATLSAAVTETGSGVAGVRFQLAPAGTSNWSDACAATAAPYSCAFATSAVPNGGYVFRAVATDVAGNTTTSTPTATRTVDNAPPTALDVQTANGGGTPGRLDAGDTLTFTYSKPMSPASIAAGWDGTATAVVVRLQDGSLVGLGGDTGDTVDVLRGGTAVNLGSVLLNQDYIKPDKTSLQNGTMTATTQTVNGSQVTVVTIVLGSLVSGGAINTVTMPSTIVWTPSPLAADLAGTPCSPAPAIETGASDREF
jgi:hypothetical protein